MPKLLVKAGKDKGSEYELGDESILGRVPEVDIQVHDTKASRRHTKVVQTAGAFYAVDMGSRNGTMVNGKKIKRVKLRPGDTITIGTTEFEFVAPQPESGKRASAADGPVDPKDVTAVTETMQRPVKSQRKKKSSAVEKTPAAKKHGDLIVPRVKEKKFDPMSLERPRVDATMLSEDLGQRPFGFKLMVFGGAVLFLLVLALLSYFLTMLAIGS